MSTAEERLAELGLSLPTDTGPHAASTAAVTVSGAAGSSMSAGSTSVSPTDSLAVSRSSSSLRAVSATRYPSVANRTATARPMPRPAPVTRAVRRSSEAGRGVGTRAVWSLP